MPSLRKRVTSYFRQLSFHNEPREKRNNLIENTFINKYLQGEIQLKEGPPIIHGKNPTDLPNYDLGYYDTGPDSIVGCYTGPNGGLTTVKRTEKHLSVLDQDIAFIDTADEPAAERKVTGPQKSPNRNSDLPLDNTTMIIKVAGQEYYVTNRKKHHNKSHSLGSLSDFQIEVDKTKKIVTNNNLTFSLKGESIHKSKQCDNRCDNTNGDNLICNKRETVRIVTYDDAKLPESNGNNQVVSSSFVLGKSKSEGNPFGHKKQGKITRLTERPTAAATIVDATYGGITIKDDPNVPQEWNNKTENVFGISDSLYDKNLISKHKNGDPIADCFGLIARPDSAILAVADGVNWGEKASIAAKSAVHGCLHYLNKTLFQDTRLFDNLVKNCEEVQKSETPIHESRITNTREVFVCLLRAFNCAHDLILENEGMLTTLTVAVILPLKQSNVKSPSSHNDQRIQGTPSRCEGNVDNYICCVCNVGDTLAYVYSQRYGVRELTKGSHDINCNRDMRDALGALGPVDGINPELSNLTLSITTVQKGDIILIASDGLTDNFDPNVCKFTINSEIAKVRKPSTTQQPTKPRENPTTSNKEPQKIPVKPPRKSHGSRSSRESSVDSSKEKLKNPQVSRIPPKSKPGSSTPHIENNKKVKIEKFTKVENTNSPLVAQFLQENSHDTSTASSQPIAPSPKPILRKPIKSVSSKDVPQSVMNTNSKISDNKYNFLRSKTSLDLRSKPIIVRNPDGVPYVTPLQRYELTLLLMEDILKKGISGKEHQCVTAQKLCENLLNFTVSITNAKRRYLEDADLYYNNQNGILVELSNQERKMRRKRGLEKAQNFPGKLDHVTVVAYNVGNTRISPR